MTEEGPPLELVLRRLADTPADFLAEPGPLPRRGDAGVVYTLAVVNDVLRMHGATSIDPRLAELEPTGPSRRAAKGKEREKEAEKAAALAANRRRLLSILAWLLADDWFLARRGDAELILTAMLATSSELAPLVPAASTVTDSERREELGRLALSHLSLRPAGESEAFARDRLTSFSTTERARVLAASRRAEERARAIREALAKKAAEESADKWTRE